MTRKSNIFSLRGQMEKYFPQECHFSRSSASKNNHPPTDTHTNIAEWQYLPQGGVLPSLAVVVISAKLLSGSILHPNALTHTHIHWSVSGQDRLSKGVNVLSHTPGSSVVVGSPYLLTIVHVTSPTENLLWLLACQHGRDTLGPEGLHPA